MSQIVRILAESMNAIGKSRVWENDEHGSVGTYIAMKLSTIDVKE